MICNRPNAINIPGYPLHCIADIEAWDYTRLRVEIDAGHLMTPGESVG
jgi:hypothetical protein